MFDAPALHLAVALLVEHDGADAFRYDPSRPIQGHCLLTDDGQGSRITLYLENGQTLSDRSGRGHFYFEGWVESGEILLSIGAFNTGATGEGTCAFVKHLPPEQLQTLDLVRVTAEPFGGSDQGHTTALEGRLVWLKGGPAEALPEPELVLVAAEEGEPYVAGDLGAEPVETGFKLYPEPATPVVGAPPAVLELPLAPRHPLASRAGGSATLRMREGGLTINLRGLPSPPSLGREAATDRPYNTYRVWLIEQRSGSRLSLGHCTRVWGENFRFQTDSGLPLTRYDTVVITADDRTLVTPNPNSPQVLVGSYRPS